jgi:glycosyltransferase involved in cell wall biosynthesis
MDRRLRLAVVTETFPPEVNGVSLSLAKLLEGAGPFCDWQLVRVNRHDLDAPMPREIRLAGFPIPGYARLRGGFPAWISLRRAWRDDRPDLVHIATEGPLGLSALQVARALNIPVCSDFRTHFEQYVDHYKVAWLEPFASGYLRYFHNRCDLNCVATEMLAKQLKAQGYERLAVVPRGVDLARFGPQHRDEALRASWLGTRAQQAGPGKVPVLLCVSRMAAEKNLEVLLQAHRAATQSGSPARLVMVGDGPIRASLERDYPEALFVGMKTGLELSRHYASADLFCFPSQSETFGNVILEAMASALPVLAYRHGASAALLQDQEHGWILRDFSPSAFHEALKAALSQWTTQDPSRWQAMGEKVLAKAKTQSWSSVVDLMLSHWYALAFPTMKAKPEHESFAHPQQL